MESIRDEISSAIRSLGISPDDFYALPDDRSPEVYYAALRHFVPRGDPKWWWEHFPEKTVRHFPNGNAWRHLTEFIPDPNQKIWFIAEDDSLPSYPVYEVIPALISQVIAECYGFEYYLVQKNFEWLLCETHHNSLVGVGRAVEERLKG